MEATTMDNLARHAIRSTCFRSTRRTGTAGILFWIIFSGFRENGHNGVRRAATSTGMGFRISWSIIESHGGRMWAEAVAGRGATFHLNLPAAIPGHSPDTPESIIVQTTGQNRK
jgi:light-regulated signal transduction histidine kinase (bacteriophytochrome)